MNGYPSFYPRIALVAPSPGDKAISCSMASYIFIYPTWRDDASVFLVTLFHVYYLKRYWYSKLSRNTLYVYCGNTVLFSYSYSHIIKCIWKLRAVHHWLFIIGLVAVLALPASVRPPVPKFHLSRKITLHGFDLECTNMGLGISSAGIDDRGHGSSSSFWWFWLRILG